MTPIQTNKSTQTHNDLLKNLVILNGIFVFVSTAIAGMYQKTAIALSIFFSGMIIEINLIVIIVLIKQTFTENARGSRIALLFMIKVLTLFGLFAILLRQNWAEPLGILIGIATIVPSCVIVSLTQKT